MYSKPEDESDTLLHPWSPQLQGLQALNNDLCNLQQQASGFNPAIISPGAMTPVNAAQLPVGGREVKRRASKACYSCRARKVKCSVVKTGLPCDNCRQDEVECAVSYARKRKRTSVEETSDSPQSGAVNDAILHEFAAPSSTMAARLDEFLATAPQSLDFRLSNHVPEAPDSTIRHASPEQAPRGSPISKDDSLTLSAPSTLPFIPPSIDLTSPPRQIHADVRFPNFIYPLGHELNADDVEYLTRKGALTVPEPTLRNELLRNYAQYVHPFLPLLDLQDLLQSINHNDGSSQISLVLFQAVMFAASSFIEIRFLIAEGFETRKDARKSFFQKARLLFDFDCELDPITLVQSLLLMTYWYEKPDDRKGPWYWMNTALGFAYATGLNRSSELVGIATKKQRLRRRLWWCCYMRAKLIALSMRKDTGIRDDEWDIPMLTRDDFDNQPLALQLIAMLGDCSSASESGQMMLLAELCIEQAKLCLCVSHVLSAHHSLSGHRLSAGAEPTMMLLPRRSAPDISEFINCEQELDQWHGNSRARMPGFFERTTAYDSEVSKIHRGILEMMYLTTSSALHRPQIISDTGSDSVVRNLQHLSREKVMDAATEITVIAKSLQDRDLVRFLPPVGVTVLLPAAIQHIRDLKSDDSTVHEVAFRRLSQIMQVLHRLRDIYCSADYAFLFVEAVIGKVNIDLPREAEQIRANIDVGSMSGHSASTTTAQTDPPNVTHNASNIINPITTNQSPPLISSQLEAEKMGVLTGATRVGNGALTKISSSTKDNAVTTTDFDFDSLMNFDVCPEVFLAEDGQNAELGNVHWAMDIISDYAFSNADSYSWFNGGEDALAV